MKKYHQMEVVKDAGVLGVLIGTLGIENYLNAIERVKILAKNHGNFFNLFFIFVDLSHLS